MKIYKDKIKLSREFPFNNSISTIQHVANDKQNFHWHECLEITYVIEGEGYYFVNGKTYSMKKNDIIIFNNIEPHSWNAKVNQKMIVSGFIFSPCILCSNISNSVDYKFLLPFLHRSTNFNNKIDYNNPISSQILSLLKDIESEHKEKLTGYELMIKTKLLNIITLLIRHFQDNSKPIENVNEKKQNLQRLQNTLSFIESNYTKNITNNELAKITCMNPSYFSTFFKQTMNISPNTYIIRLRINRAQLLIKSSDRTLLDIAFDCGFNNMSNFYRAYKKIVGKTPSQTRNRN